MNHYENKFLFSKSVGTLIAECFSKDLLNTFTKQFYFTPFIDLEKCISPDSFVYCGNDKFTDDKYKMEAYASGYRFYPDLDHSLTITNDIHKSISALDSIISDFEYDFNS